MIGYLADANEVLPPFGWGTAASQWQFAPLVTGLAAAAGAAYLCGVVAVARRHPARPWPWWRTGLFLAGLAVIGVATQSGVGAYDDVLFWDHMIQHLLLIMVAPPLLVAGQPVTLLLHASRNPVHTWAKNAIRSRAVTTLTWPPLTIALYIAVIVGTHLTGLMNLVLTSENLHNLEHAVYLVAGYLFFLPLIGREPLRWRLSYPLRMAVLAITMPVDTFTGVILGSASASMFPAYAGVHRSWGPTVTDDLHLGGATMWIGGDAIMVILIMIIFAAWATDRRPAASGAQAAETERLASYNDYLAQLNAGHGSPPQ